MLEVLSTTGGRRARAPAPFEGLSSAEFSTDALGQCRHCMREASIDPAELPTAGTARITAGSVIRRSAGRVPPASVLRSPASARGRRFIVAATCDRSTCVMTCSRIASNGFHIAAMHLDRWDVTWLSNPDSTQGAANNAEHESIDGGGP
jgi:hypothetical protein